MHLQVATALYFWITLSYRLAKALSILFHPLLTAAYLLVAVTAIAAPSDWPAVGWLALVLACRSAARACISGCGSVPKRVEDFQIMLREQRLQPLLVSLGFGALALAVVLAAGGPRALVLALSVGVANGIALTLITLGMEDQLPHGHTHRFRGRALVVRGAGSGRAACARGGSGMGASAAAATHPRPSRGGSSGGGCGVEPW